MHSKLQAIEIENNIRNWSIEGLAKFGELLRTPTESIHELGDLIISFVVKYTNSNQGALYVVNDLNSNDLYLELLSCYAWNKKKYIDQRIEIGEGLVGQAWQENDIIHLTEIPNDFVNITSGLGGANPSSILISPLALNGEVFGIIEIASFDKYSPSIIQFIHTISESIASTLSTTKTNERTKRLLEQSQQMTEEMRAQEEEIRQNMEEMNATQEEMERIEREMRHRVKALEREIEEITQHQNII
jgi:transcriptional regulator with GAF, ATPase, and Fis domain